MSLSIIVMGASGRMGTTIANLAKEQGMTLAAVLERPERLDALAHWGCLAGTDPEVVYPQVPGAVVIDFTAPEASLANARCAVKNGNPIVIGTTGFTPEQKAELDAIAQNGRVFWSPNMSVGVNVLLELLPELVQMLGPDYDLEMVELHHNRKKDSPSGTALRLAESLASARDWDLKDVACYHREGIIGERPKKEIGVQAIRGVVMMSFSNKFHWMLLATGNKSEVAAGYCTMYGDTCGGLAPIADLYKTEVYQLAQWFNEREGMCAIPQNIFDKAPSAELRPGQKDQDSLPEYDVLDSILHALIEESKRAEDIDLPGVTPEDVNRVQALMRRSAFKRLQLPPLLPVGNHAFGVHVHM